MLDTIEYVKNNDGSFTKTVTNISKVEDIQNEIAAIQAQLLAFQLSQDLNPSDEIYAAILNYQNQLVNLGVS